jgi:ribosomal protein L10
MAKNAPRAKKRIGKAPKLAQLARLMALTKSAESVVVANISAMKVGDLTKLRADMRKQGARLVIAKSNHQARTRGNGKSFH